MLTLVSITQGIDHPSGGTTLQIPYGRALSDIDLMYCIGSLNSSAVG